MSSVIHGDDTDNVLHYDDTYTVYGHGGSDALSGGIMYGGKGDDYYHVDSPSDRVIEYPHEGTDTVLSWISSYRLTDHVENLVLDGSNAIEGLGNELANTISGNDNHNKLKGEAGNDTLKGGFGNDTLIGGNGDDRLIGFSYDGKNEIDTLKGEAGSDTFVLHYQTTNGNKAAYNDGKIGAFNSSGQFVSSPGLTDYALIRDFNKSQDKIELAGSASDYILAASPIAGTSGTAIYLKTPTLIGDSSGRELIAVLKDVNAANLSLNSGYFSYV